MPSTPDSKESDDDPANWLKTTFRDVTIRVETADITFEMQFARQPKYIERALYYLADLYTSNHGRLSEVPNNFASLKPVWSMSILGFTQFPQDSVAIRVFSLRDDASGDSLKPVLLRLGFFELTKPTSDKILTEWRHFFESGKVGSDAPAYLQQAAAIIDYHNLSPEERKMIDAETKARDISQAIYAGILEEAQIARDNALVEGRVAGHAEGLKEGLHRTVKGMVAEGYTSETISKITGLSLTEIGMLSSN